MLIIKQESCQYQFFMAFGLTRPGIEQESTISVADTRSTRQLIGLRKIKPLNQ